MIIKDYLSYLQEIPINIIEHDPDSMRIIEYKGQTYFAVERRQGAKRLFRIDDIKRLQVIKGESKFTALPPGKINLDRMSKSKYKLIDKVKFEYSESEGYGKSTQTFRFPQKCKLFPKGALLRSYIKLSWQQLVGKGNPGMIVRKK